MKTLTVGLLAGALVIMTAGRTHANVTNITSGGPEYPAFAPAITAAAQGDTLRGRAAVWNEIAVVPPNKHVTLDGGYNATYTSKIGYSVVTNESTGPVFQINPGAKVYMQSLIIKGGNGTGPGAGGVWALLSTAIVVNCVVTNCASQYGAGLNSAGLIIASNTHVVGNFATKQGGGVFVRFGSAFHAHQNTLIRGNVSAQEGGGIFAQPGLVEVVNSTISNNTAATSDGGGIYAPSGVVVRVTGSALVGNQAAVHGGGLFAEIADVVIRNSGIAGNNATNDGGGIKSQGGTLVISNSSIVGNTALWGGGGGVHSSFDVLRVFDSSIGTLARPNAASSFGAGLAAQLSDVRLQNVTIEGNTGQWVFVGGAYIMADTPVWASNVMVRFNKGNANAGLNWMGNGGLDAHHLHIVSNYATFNGAGLLSAQSNLFVDTLRVVGNTSEFATAGLSINLWQATGVIHRARFEFNRSNNGIGAGAIGGGGADLLTINDLYVADNTGDADNDHVGGTGGLEFWSVKAHVRPVAAPVTITRNTGGQRGALFMHGSHVSFHAPSPAQSVWITENTAVPTSGVGAVHVEAGWYGATAAFYGAVHVLSNVGYHGGLVLTNENYYWNSNQAYFVAVPSNGNAAQIAFNRSEGPGGGLYVHGEGTAARLHSTRLLNNFVGFNFPGGGGAAVSDGGQARFINALIAGNFSSNFAGGVAVAGQSSRLYLDADFATAPPSALPPTRVLNNYAHLSGGGVAAFPGAELFLYNTLVASNRAANAMGGGVLVQAGMADLRNAVITRNNAGMQGDGIAVFSSPQFGMVNSTVAHNDTNGLYVLNTPMSFIQNTIVWGHGGLGYEFTELIFTSTLQHCTVQGGYPGTLVLTNDPLFWAPAALDYQLSPGSPCVDTGVVSVVTLDCIGTTRPQMAAYDIGAYEFVPEPAGVLALAAAALLVRRRVAAHTT